MNLFFNYSGIVYPFKVEALKKVDGEIQKFSIDMSDNNPSIIGYEYHGWNQYAGKQLFSDHITLMGNAIEKNFPELF